MKTTKKLALTVCLAGGLITGCANMSDTEQRTLSGAAIGTAAGAAIGAAAGKPLTGAAVGAAAGTASGYLYDRHKKAQEK